MYIVLVKYVANKLVLYCFVELLLYATFLLQLCAKLEFL